MFIPINEPPLPFEAAIEMIAAQDESDSTSRRVRRRSRSRRFLLPLAAGLVAAVGVGGFALLSRPAGNAEAQPAALPKEDRSKEDASSSTSDEPGASSPTPVATAKVDVPRPITLRAMPAGVRVVVHLHCAKLWRNDRRGNELRKCVSPLAEWAHAAIEKQCRFAPEQIETVTFGVVLKGPGVAPAVTAVVKLVESVPIGDVKKKLPRGANDEAESSRPYISTDRAVLILDDRTFVVAPRELAAEISADGLNPTDVSIEELLPLTDQNDEITFLGRPDDVLVQIDTLFPNAAHEFVRAVADWFDPAVVESAAIRFRIDDELLQSRFQLRHSAELSTSETAAELRKRLEDMPRRMVSYVEKIAPRDSGRRQILGRLPAMLKACVMGAEISPGSKRMIAWNTTLPERAAPNLALAGYLLWDESRSPSATTSRLAGRPEPGTGKKSIAERLRKPIDVDFRRTPLHEAIAAIAAETNVSIELDGAGLQQSGFTRNMPQTMSLKGTPAVDVLAAIFKQYAQMVIAEESPERAVVTIQPVAAARKWKLLSLDAVP